MKLAIISVSDKGQKLASQLKYKLDSDSTVIKCDLYHKNVKKYFPLLFSEYDGIIAVMASGILIRSIAPLIVSKTTDPAVLNIDDNGKFVISTLSGHLGGANELTDKIAKLIDATPVITTSTDVNRKLGIDVLARDLYLSIDDTKKILPFNKAILEGREIVFTLNPEGDFTYLHDYLEKNTLEINVLFSNSVNVARDEILVSFDEHEITLKEKKIVAGMGCRKNKECKKIYEGFIKSLDDLKIHPKRVNMLSSAEIKKQEKGLLDLSKYLDIPIHFVEMDKLKLFTSPDTSKSEFVKLKFGIDGVCEQSALICAGYDSKLIYKKTSYGGVTVAVAVSKK